MHLRPEFEQLDSVDWPYKESVSNAAPPTAFTKIPLHSASASTYLEQRKSKLLVTVINDKPKLFSGSPECPWRKHQVQVLLTLRSTNGCLAIAHDCILLAPLHGEPTTADGYPVEEMALQHNGNADLLIAARPTHTRISIWRNCVAFKLILDSLSEPIQQAVMAQTDMASWPPKLSDIWQLSMLRMLEPYLEMGSIKALYTLTMTSTEPLQMYLSRAADLYSQIPTIQGVSTTSMATYLNIVVQGLKPRSEYDGFRQSFYNAVCPDFASFQLRITQYNMVMDIPTILSPEEAEHLAAAAYRGNYSGNRQRQTSKAITCWNCGGYGHNSRECPSSDAELAHRPVDSNAADKGSRSPPKERGSDDRKPGSKSKSPQRYRRDYSKTRLKRDYSRGRHAHVANGDCST
eukprot:gene3676-biopygen21418